jgi:hypothetical protein
MKTIIAPNGNELQISNNLLSKGDTNAKLIKNFLESHILYLNPWKQNSLNINLCAGASDNCIQVCIYTTGRGVMAPVQEGRTRRTELYIQHRNYFLNMLLNELTKLNKKALREGKQIAVRLNGTSDLDFIAILKNRFNIDILDAFPGLEFYDYTKILGKVKKYAGTRYKLTFSRSETNELECIEALNLGAPVSVVFDDKKPMPSVYLGAKVIDGDLADDIMLTAEPGTIIGLKAKGKARKDKTSGFVVI